MKTGRMKAGFVFVAISQVVILLAIWGLSIVCDLLIAAVYRLGRFGLCDGAIQLLNRLCERGSAEISVEENDVEND